ncbi:MAG: hypothetical protein RDU24_15240 [Humidesulfovibrio sp.]|uniref:hypothetical protein n=1 Tax=Humidesulfovibrio sp. TaxID=2910988 RepID=UPI0027FA0205|nr:hypothetical protein [Humidesulfovibrio sp.]MDQ7836732.1 hypothetical protein [Humidesulfovibrio sp.]
MSDFRGARGSNTGDDYHELWATRHAIRLLDDRDPLQALVVEGLASADEASASEATWDGVDCTLYEGGRDAREADRVVVEQLKYSAANPLSTWTVARLTQGKKRQDSVFNRFARAWSGIQGLEPKGHVEVVLVTNQQISSAVTTAISAIAAGGVVIPKKRPANGATDEAKLAFATGLAKADLPEFARSLRFEGGMGSRFAIEEQLLGDMAAWTDLDLQQSVASLRQFIRHRMRPEFAGELITKESVLLHVVGVSNIGALFPCPQELTRIAQPVSRESVAEVAHRIVAGEQRVCLHGPGGIGKTTALQQIEDALPENSVMITFDCYGGGRYLDPAALRHRPIDAFLQLSNELATRLRMPILLGRHQISDPARLFVNRLRHAAQAHAAEYPYALIVLAVDAADNAVTAAAARKPPESCFVHDFIGLVDLPANVRFIVTARTGRLPELALPSSFQSTEILPFILAETTEHVRKTWDAPADWLDIFHSLTAGVPRVQAYAMDLGGQPPEKALDRLLPGGRSLDQVFREQIERALGKSGNPSDVAKFCAGLVALARPVPLTDLSGVLTILESVLVDICADMAPAVRLKEGRVSFADEDFEYFVRKEGISAMAEVTQNAAAWQLGRCGSDSYAAKHVAGALVAAGRGGDLLELVEREPAPEIVADPVQRREVELTRLRLAISVCREAGDPARALRFVQIGGEGLKTERALRSLLCENPDLAVRFAPETAGRLILSDPDQIGAHGPFLLHKQVISAEVGDGISLREGRRMLTAWMAARKDVIAERRASAWRLELADVAADVEAALKARGPEQALKKLRSWSPKRVRLEVAKYLVPRLLAEGHADLIQSVLDTGELRPWEEIFLLVPMAIATIPVDRQRLAAGLKALTQYRMNVRQFFSSSAHGRGHLPWVFDIAMCACELLTREDAARTLVDSLLEEIMQPANRSIAIHSLDDTGRLDLLLRAYTLQAVRSGQIPEQSGLFEHRPKPVDKGAKRQHDYREEESDRRLKEAVSSVFNIYAARAMVLAGTGKGDAESAEELLKRYSKRREEDHWRFSTRRGAGTLAMAAARSLLVLLGTNMDPQILTKRATHIHGRWGTGDLSPDEDFAVRIALCPALHPTLVDGVDASVRQIRGRRIGAGDKSKALVTYARLLLPVSLDDANAVFNDAVEAASQLDEEIIPQLRLLGSLFTRGIDCVGDRRSAAQNLSEIMADAAICLEGYDGLPWDEVMETLAALDLPLALANAARWEDADLARLGYTLPPVLKTGVLTRALQPAAAVALDLLLHGDHQVNEAALQAFSGSAPSVFLEEAAWDSLIRHNHRKADKLLELIAATKVTGRWTTALRERHSFLSRLPNEERAESAHQATSASQRGHSVDLVKPSWTRDVLLNAEELDRVILATLKDARAAGHYIAASEVLGWAAATVAMRDRIPFLDILCKIKSGIGVETMEKLMDLLSEWNSPAIRSWAAISFPDVIIDHFPEFVRYIDHDQSLLPKALEYPAMSPAKTIDLLLCGVELHGQSLSGGQVFALAGLISGYLDATAAADLGIWYAERLAYRIAPEDRDQTWGSDELPTAVPAAVARVLYACLGDFDVRVRWRAGHAIRRLARLSATEELQALIAEYGRLKEEVYRSPRLDFYWIAARLWFVIAWDRISAEMPDIGKLAGPMLLAIARNEDFTHVLVRSFARDACLKLVDGGRLSLNEAEIQQLKDVARSTLPTQPGPKGHPAGWGRHSDAECRRFQFDSMDTIPYWYVPVLREFADVSLDQLLTTAEAWIIDRWGYPGNIRAYNAERRRHRFTGQNWSLTSNRHGSNPTIERLNNHLEWHALWCAVGELMRTEPLVAHEEPVWDDLTQRIAREMLTEPPLWSADLRVPTPLRPDFWCASNASLPEWVTDVREGRMRRELEAADRPGYFVVDGWWEIRSNNRVETVSFSSALVEPTVADAVLRALQTMESAWDYKLPDENEERFEVDESPYRMVGWVQNISCDGGIDTQDPLCGVANNLDLRPGRRVRDACGLSCDVTGKPYWSVQGRPPMFLYEVWGERDDDERYSTDVAVSGRRLLVERDQLMEFLESEGFDLVIEVEVNREGRGNRRSYDEKDDTPKAQYDRLYRLDRAGGLHTAEGRVGTWSGDCPST